jgi:hypothetical protein
MGAVGLTVFLFYAFEIDDAVKELWENRKFKTPKILNPHVKRLQKIEQDGQKALTAIRNFHETKKRLNKEFRDDWDQQYRLLLPPPPTPNRQALAFSYSGLRYPAYKHPRMRWDDKDQVLVEPEHHPVPVGAIEGDHGWWFGFNNLPGHPNEMYFIQTDKFREVRDPRFWAFLPTIKELPNGEYTWQESKSKALAANIKDAVFTTG